MNVPPGLHLSVLGRNPTEWVGEYIKISDIYKLKMATVDKKWINK